MLDWLRVFLILAEEIIRDQIDQIIFGGNKIINEASMDSNSNRLIVNNSKVRDNNKLSKEASISSNNNSSNSNTNNNNNNKDNSNSSNNKRKHNNKAHIIISRVRINKIRL